MKFTSFSRWLRPLLCFGFTVLASHTTRAADRPALSIEEATKIARDVLTSKGVADEVFIESVALRPTALMAGKMVWYVEWSASIPTSQEGKKAVGVEIAMNGDVVHVVNARAKKKHVSPR